MTPDGGRVEGGFGRPTTPGGGRVDGGCGRETTAGADNGFDRGEGARKRSESQPAPRPRSSWQKMSIWEATITSSTASRLQLGLEGQAETRAYLNFVEHRWFETSIGIVIGLNILVLSGETDTSDPGWIWWTIYDNLFLVIYIIELGLRVLHRGVTHFLVKDKAWNLLDTCIVVLGIFDLWVIPYKNGGRSVGAALGRFLRLLRLVRLVRIIKIFRRLAVFARGFLDMLVPLAIYFGIFFMCLGVIAIVLTQILGHGVGLSDEAMSGDFDQMVRANFQSVPTTFFTLFQITTTDNWDRIAEPVIAIDSKWRLFFVAFIIFFSWTMISILTAVASDNMLSATLDSLENKAHERERKHKEFAVDLRRAFEEYDEDGNGLLEWEEFKTVIEQDKMRELFKFLEVRYNKEEMYHLWDMLDIKRSGVLTLEDFLDGLMWLQEGLSTKHLVSIDASIRRLEARLEPRLRDLERKVQGWRKKNAILTESLRKQEEVYYQQDMSLWLWSQWAAKNSANVPESLKQSAMLPPPEREEGNLRAKWGRQAEEEEEEGAPL